MSKNRWLVVVALLLVVALVLLWRLMGPPADSAPDEKPSKADRKRRPTGQGSAAPREPAGPGAKDAWVDPMDPKNHGAIVGRIRFEDGRVPATLRVELSSHYERVTRDGAAFRIAGVPRGSHPLRLSGDFLALPVRPVFVKAGKDTDVGELVVIRGRTLRGRVLDAKGAPVPQAHVIVGERLGCDATSIGQVFGKGATTIADTDGRFMFSDLVLDRLLLAGERATVGRSRPTPIEAGNEDREVTLTLEPFATLAGRVRGAQSDRDTGMRSHVRVSPKESLTDSVEVSCAVQVAADGTFKLDHLLAGPYVVTADTLIPMDGGRTIMRERRAGATLRAGETTTIDLDLAPSKGVDLVVAVTESDNRFVMRHVLFRGAMSKGTQAQLDAAVLRSPEAWQASGLGRATLHEVPPGRYTLCTVRFPPLDSSVMIEYMRDMVMSLPADCRPVEVTATPAEQVVEFALAKPI